MRHMMRWIQGYNTGRRRNDDFWANIPMPAVILISLFWIVLIVLSI